MICAYCHNEAKWCENKEVYGKNYGKSYMCYYCKPCDAYVGCHNNTRKPLGTMANKKLRNLRIETHKVIDAQWKSGLMKRGEMYAMLRREFGKTIHVGESDENQCLAILRLFGVKK